MLHLSTVADSKNSNLSWVNIQSARWVKIQSARTAIEAKGDDLVVSIARSESWGDPTPSNAEDLINDFGFQKVLARNYEEAGHPWGPQPDEYFQDYWRRMYALLGKGTKPDPLLWRILKKWCRSKNRSPKKTLGAIIDMDFGEAFFRTTWLLIRGYLPAPSRLGERFSVLLTQHQHTAPGNWFGQISTFLNAAIQSIDTGKSTVGPQEGLQSVCAVLKDLAQRYISPSFADRFSWLSSTDGKTAFWVMDIASKLIQPLADIELNRSVWMNPARRPSGEWLSMSGVVEEGRIVVFQPSIAMTESDLIYGRTLKRLFFKFTFTRKSKQRGVAYVCDEFQRFVSGDPETGEQSFLDRSRAYRGICVLATQSIASMQYELLSRDSATSRDALQLAVASLLNNIGNKFFFRSTDTSTSDFLAKQIPSPPGNGPNFLSVRPISTLIQGSCVFLSADGKWGLHRIQLQPAARSN